MSGLVKLDAPGTRCAFESHGCSRLALAAGGFDLHHPDPIDDGGDAHQDKIPLCPLHHRRQHSLIRYLVEADESGTEPAWEVIRRFTPAERDTAELAIKAWVARGRPPITNWPCPAARAV